MTDSIVLRRTDEKAQAWADLAQQLQVVADQARDEAERLLGPDRGQ